MVWALGAAVFIYAAGYFLFRRRGFHYDPASLFLPVNSGFTAREEEGDAVYHVTPARPPLAPLAIGAACVAAIAVGAILFSDGARGAALTAAMGAVAWLFVFFSPFARNPSRRRAVDIAWVGGSLAVDGKSWRRDEIAAIAVRNAAAKNAAPAAKARNYAVSLVAENGGETLLASGLAPETAEALGAGLSAQIGAPAA